MPWLLDRLTLRPTTHEIELPDGAVRVQLSSADNSVDAIDSVELVHRQVNQTAGNATRLNVCKFVGAGGRAENFSGHPLDQWTHIPGTVSCVNPPGFGNSSGRANLGTMVTAAMAAVQYVLDKNPNDRLLLTGGSLGAAVAMHVAARLVGQNEHRLCGLMLRDPPQLRDVIMQRFGWWTGWIPAWTVARRTPDSFNAYRAATQCHDVPALIVTSLADTIVPANIQQKVIDAYSGPKRIVSLAYANHSEPMNDFEMAEYSQALEWLETQIGLS